MLYESIKKLVQYGIDTGLMLKASASMRLIFCLI